MCSADIFLALIAILFPPLAVWVKRGLCSCDSLINIALCCLGYLPGLLHAWYIISVTPDEYEYERIADAEHGRGERVTYYFVSGPLSQQQQRENASYGSMGGQQAQQPQPRQPPPQNTLQQQQGAGEGGSEAAPPPYNEAIRGDHKVQT